MVSQKYIAVSGLILAGHLSSLGLTFFIFKVRNLYKIIFKVLHKFKILKTMWRRTEENELIQYWCTLNCSLRSYRYNIVQDEGGEVYCFGQ